MCGIIGTIVASGSRVNQDIFDALTAVQHRGQDAAGIMTCDKNKVFLRKSNGLVRDVVHTRHMLRLQGNMGIGHVRYPTAGSSSAAEAQPFYVNSPYGLAIAHNGNLVNAQELEEALFVTDLRHLNTGSDSEILLNVLAHELQQLGKVKLTPDALFQAVKAVHRRCKGGYAAVVMITGYGILGFRDPHGIRPLVFGKRQNQTNPKHHDYMISSESVVLSTLGYQLENDVQPGEAIFIDLEGNCLRQQCADHPVLAPCLFEYVYLARPDSIIDKVSVYQARSYMGEALAAKILQQRPQHDIDVVIPIPDTSRIAALALAQKLGVKYCEGFVKNRYVGRTFIMPGQQQRKKSVRTKLNPIDLEFKDKNVLLVDDSIVRGTTSKEIIQMARDAGARKVYFASAAPEICYPNVYGIDMPSAKELIAHDRTVEEIAKLLNADWLIYQDLNALYEAVKAQNPNIKNFEDSVFTGKYIAGNIDADYLKRLEEARNDKSKHSQTATFYDGQIVEMYNTGE
jgi:amidophosphoribosyltransferase